jgi:hypothetical protein
MDWATGAAITVVLGFAIGWIVKLTLALSKADAKAEAASIAASNAAVAAASLRVSIENSEIKMREAIDKTESQLVEHRVYVAREYVSNQTIAGLEDKLIKAIDRLGDRLDSLFTAQAAKGAD